MTELIRENIDGMYQIGIDEAGRGALAGPVVAASFMDMNDFRAPKGLNDSKKMSARQRDYCYDYVIAEYPDRFGIGCVDNNRIDQINILKATMQAMQLAVEHNPSFMKGYAHGWDKFGSYLMVDGNYFESFDYPGWHDRKIPYSTVVKGDSKYENIAMASVMAKVFRDRLMCQMSRHEFYSKYNWDRNKGYGTADHIAMIIQHGKSQMHRQTFKVPGYDK